MGCASASELSLLDHCAARQGDIKPLYTNSTLAVD